MFGCGDRTPRKFEVTQNMGDLWVASVCVSGAGLDVSGAWLGVSGVRSGVYGACLDVSGACLDVPGACFGCCDRMVLLPS